MKKSSTFAMVALICLIAPFVMITVGIGLRTDVTVGIIAGIVGFILSIVGIVMAKKGKTSKGFSVFTLILSIIVTLCFLIGLGMGAVIKDSTKTRDMCTSLTNCKYIGNNESMCYSDGDTKEIIGIYCANDVLKPEQFK